MSNLFKRNSSEIKDQKDILDLLIKFEPIRCKPDLNSEKMKRLRKKGYSNFLSDIQVQREQIETLKRYLESVR